MKLRNRFTGAAAAALSATGLLVGLMSVSSAALAVSSEIYNWQNVRIDGGGFVPGVVFNQKERDLIYARTDIGGAYRWNPATSSWVPLLDWVGWDNWGWNGVLSLATDPVDTNRVYVAAGMYTNSWDPNNGAILRSTDKGATWKSTPLPFKVGGNMPGRGQGERLAIDPNKNNIIYFGAEGGNGLWRSIDYGATWAKVSSFTNGGTYVQDPTDTNGYLSQLQGVTWVTFDPSSSSSGSASQIIYVGVADKANPVYRSIDGGATWAPLAGTPTNYLAHKGVYDAVNKFLYISTSDTGGPYDGAKGEVWKLNTQTGIWTNISPIPLSSSDLYFGYSGLTIDRKNPQTIMVASQVAWWPDAIFFRSTDGGATWSRIWDWAGYPSRSFRYTQDITENPWLNFGVTSPVAPDTAPKLGWMNESLEIDPFNSNRLMYGTGATLYATDNLTNWDAGTQILIKPRAKGIEETAVLDLVSPPTGAPLYSALGDIAGFRHDDLTKVPAYNYTAPIHTSTTSIDYAELNPSILVRVGNVDSTGGIGITTSSGNSWWAGQAPSGVTSGGNVALAADGGSIVWSPGGIAVQMSTTFGSTWVASTGVPTGATVESDRVNPAKFYAVSGSNFYVSTNKGASFTTAAGAGMPAATRKFKAVYGREGDIWLASDTDTAGGLYHSTDSGASFAKIAGVDKADNVSFGKAAPNQAYPAIYIVGQVDGVRGVFRSNDAAASWVRINDDLHQYGNLGDALSGDPRVYGRVYIGTNGRGIIWGDSTTVSSASSSSVVTTSTSSSVKTSSSTSSSTTSVATSTSSLATSTSSSVKTSSSIPSSTSSSTSSSSSSTCAAAQCNWYGTYYPVCVTTTSGWGYENGKSCIATSTCSAQPSPYGVVTNACGTSSSSVATSTSSSVVSTSTSSSVKTSSSTPSSTSSAKTSTSSSVVSTSSSVATSSSRSSSSSSSSSSSAAANKCQYVVTNEWNTGFTAAVRITNTGTTAINGWNVSWTYSDGSSLTSAWGGTLSGTNPYTGTNLDWNKTIQPGQTVEMGMQGTKGSSTSAQVPAVTGAACN